MTADRRLALAYHERTEHRLPANFSRSLGYLDWANQPDPFLRYQGAVQLHLPTPPPPPAPPSLDEALAGQVPAAELGLESVSQLLYDSVAISAWKQHGASRWSLRCNPSSGNLHPTETYLLCPVLDGTMPEPSLAHYCPLDHGLEIRRLLNASALEQVRAAVCPGGLLLGLTSIHWREAWKYGERAYRYCQHDVGHAIGALAYAAAALGWRVWRLELDANSLAPLLAVDEERGPETEHAEVLLAVGPEHVPMATTELAALLAPLANTPRLGTAQPLSRDHEEWPVISEVASACKGTWPATTRPAGLAPVPLVGRSSSLRQLARTRRSAVQMEPSESKMQRADLMRILARFHPTELPIAALASEPLVQLVVFSHRVDDLEPGIYLLTRDERALADLRRRCAPDFDWTPVPASLGEGTQLHCLLRGDVRELAAALSCGQSIAGDGCFAVSMIADLERALASGAGAYRRLHWEAGALGQVLYLETEAQGSLGGTGIGCFFDDGARGVLGLERSGWRVIYHFTVGAPCHDPRLVTLPAYPT